MPSLLIQTENLCATVCIKFAWCSLKALPAPSWVTKFCDAKNSILKFQNVTMKHMTWRESRCRAEQRSAGLRVCFNQQTGRRGEERWQRWTKQGAKERDSWWERPGRNTERRERETYYRHRLITMYSPTLTGTRRGHNTHTWDLPLAKRKAHFSQREVCRDPLINNDAPGFRHVHLRQLTVY